MTFFHRIRLLELCNRAIVDFLCFLLVFQPLLADAAQLKADPNASAANRPVISQAANGVPMVNIATPNAKGLSHNQYHDFNVGNKGLILNNATAEMGRSKLGGIVEGNPNLQSSGPASVILNEVTSTNPSTLKGMLEVYGHSADVIIANPNGLTCNGCGFINTPRATLTTGVPQIGADGTLQGFQVGQGRIDIGRNGADLSQTDIFDLVSRKIHIDGAINAKDQLGLFSGRNVFHYTSRQVDPQKTSGKSAPEVAIDSTAFGGMYAGRIQIIATEAGTGVKMRGDMAANAQAMHITANGQIVFNHATAKTDLTATSANKGITVNDVAYAGKNLSLNGHTQVTLAKQAEVAAHQAITVTSQTLTLGDKSQILNGVDAKGNTTHTHDAIHLHTGGSATLGQGQISSSGALELTANTLDLSRSAAATSGTLTAQNGLTIEAQKILAQYGRIATNGNLTLRGVPDLTLDHGQYTAQGTIQVSASQLLSSATMSAGGNYTATVTGQQLQNSGRVHSNAGVVLKSTGALTNSGSISAQTTLQASAGTTLSNTGKLNANGMQLSASALVNSGSLLNYQQALQLIAHQTLSNSGQIDSLDTLTLNDAGALTNSGTLVAQQQLTLNARMLSNSGQMNAAHLHGTVSGLDNQGAIESLSGDLILQDSGDLTNQGQLVSSAKKSDIEVQGDVHNEGTISAKTALSLTVDGVYQSQTQGILQAGSVAVQAHGIENGGQMTASQGTLTLQSGQNITNSDLIQAKQGLTLTLPGTLTNSGMVLSEQALQVGTAHQQSITALDNSGNIKAASQSLRVRTLSNQGLMGATGDITLSDSGALTNSGTVSASGVLQLSAASLTNSGTLNGTNSAGLIIAHDAENQTKGQLSGGTLTLQTAALTNAGTVDASAGPLTLVSSGTITNIGSVLSQDGLTVQAPQMVNQGTVQASGVVSLSGGTLTNQTKGQLKAASVSLQLRGLSNAGTLGATNGALTVNDSGDFSNSGSLIGNQSASLNVQGAFSNLGVIESQQALNVTAVADLSNQGTLQSQANTRVAVEGSVTNNGTLASGQQLSLQVGQAYQSQSNGQLSGASVDLIAHQVRNGGQITASQGTLTVRSAQDIRNSGTLQAKQDVTLILPGTLNNSGTVASEQSVSVGTAQQQAITALTNTGQLSGTEVSLPVKAFSNSGTLQATNQLTVHDRGDWTNSGTLASGGDAILQVGGALINQGQLSAHDQLQVTVVGVKGLQNDAQATLSGGQLILNSTELTNQGALGASAHDATLTVSGSFTNTGQLLSAANMAVSVGQNLTNQGKLEAAQLLLLQGAANDQVLPQVINKGTGVILADQLESRLGQLSNLGQLGTTGGALTLSTTGDLTNSGQLIGGGTTGLQVTGALNNSGTLSAAGAMTLSAASLTNSGVVSGADDAQITVQHDANNQSQGQLSAGTLQLQAADLTNAGVLGTTSGTLALTSGSDITNSGTMQAKQEFTLTLPGTLNNSGTVLSEQALNVGTAHQRAIKVLTNSGTVKAASLSLPVQLLENQGLIGSTGVLSVTDSGALTNEGQLLAQGNGTLQVAGVLTNTGTVSANGTLQLGGVSQVSSGAVINQQGATLSGEALSLDMASLTNAGTLGGVDSLTLTSPGTVTNSGSVLSQQGLTMQAGQIVNQGELQASGAASLIGGTFTNQAKGQLKAARVTLQLKGLSNAGTVGASDGALTVDDRGDLTNSGTLIGNHQATLSVNGALTNSGTLESQQALQVTAQQGLTNKGTLLSLAKTTLAVAGAVVNDGILASGQKLQLTGVSGKASGDYQSGQQSRILGQVVQLNAHQVTNQGRMLASQGALTVTSATDVTNQGVMAAKQGLDLTLPGTLTNSGTLASEQGVSVGTAQQQAITALTNTGQLSGTEVSLPVKVFSNSGTLQATKQLTLNDSGDWANTGTLASGGDAIVQVGGALTNQGQLSAKDQLQVRVDGVKGLDNDAKAILSGGQLTLNTFQLTNLGQLGTTGGALTLSTTGDLTNSGQLIGGGTIGLQVTGALNNSGTLSAAGAMTLSAASLTNSGVVSGADDAQITVQHDANNQSQGQLSAGTLQLQAAGLTNAGVLGTTSGTLALTSGRDITNSGTMQAKQEFTLTLPGTLSNSGTVLSEQALSVGTAHQRAIKALANSGTVKAASLSLPVQSLENQGLIGSTGALSVTDSGALTNEGQLLAQGNGTLQVAGVLTNTGTVSTNGTLQLGGVSQVSSGAVINQQGATLSGGALSLDMASLTNAGTLGSARGDVTLISEGALVNQGRVISQRDLLAQVGGTLTNGGMVLAHQHLQLSGEKAGSTLHGLNNEAKGRLLGAAMSADVANLDNAGLIHTTSGALTLNDQGRLTNSGILLADQSAMKLQASDVTNTGTIQSSGNTLALISGQEISNQGLIQSKKGLTLTIPGTLSNRGTILSQQTLTITGAKNHISGVVNNMAQGQLKAAQLALSSSHITNAGLMGTSGALTIHTPGQLSNSGQLVAGSDASLRLGTLDNQGTLGASDTLILQVDGKGTKQQAALTNEAKAHLVGGTLSLSGNRIQNLGILGTTTGDLTIHSAGVLDNQGQLLSHHALQLALGQGLSNQGTIQAGQLLTLTGQHTEDATALSNATGGQIQAAAMTLTTSQLTNQGQIGAASGALTITDQGNWQNDGQLTGMADTTLTVNGSFANTGQITSHGDLRLNALHDATNDGTFNSAATNTVQVGGHYTSGAASQLAGQQLTLQASSLTNGGLMQASDGDLNVTSAKGITNSGLMQSSGVLALTLPGNITNSGTLQSEQELTVGTAQKGAIATLTNQHGGQIKAASLSLPVAALVNAGLIGTPGQLVIHDHGALTNSGQIMTQGNTELAVNGQVTNSGLIAIGKQLQLMNLNRDASGAIKNQTHGQITAGSLQLNARSLTNQGTLGTLDGDALITTSGTLTNSGILQSAGGLQLTVHQALTNDTAGQIQGGTLTVTSQGLTNAGVLGARTGLFQLTDIGDVTNSGQLLANAGQLLTITGSLTNTGVIQSLKHMMVTTHTDKLAGIYQSSASGVLRGQSVTLQSDDVTNAGRITASAGILKLSSQHHISNSGAIEAKKALQLILPGSFTNSGTLLSEQDLSVAQASGAAIAGLTNDQSGQIQATTVSLPVALLNNAGHIRAVKTLSVTDHGTLTNQGTMQANENISLHVNGNVDNQGTLSAGGSLQLQGLAQGTSGALDNEQHGQWIGGQVSLHSAAVTNQGTLGSSLGDVTLVTPGTVTNNGTLISQGNLSLQTDQNLTNSGTLLAYQQLTLSGLKATQANATLSNSGTLQGGTVHLHSTTVNNTGMMEATQSGGFTLTTSNALTNDGTLGSLDTLTLHIGHGLTNLGQIEAKQALNLMLNGDVDNRGTLLSEQALSVQGVATLTNTASGHIRAASLSLPVRAFSNAGYIGAEKDLTLSDQGNFANSGRLLSAGNSTLMVAGTVTNQGQLQANGTLQLSGLNHQPTEILTNTAHATLSAGTVSVSAASLSNAGTLSSGRGGMTLTTAGALGNSGSLLSQGNLQLAVAQRVNNSGTVQAVKTLTLTGAGGANVSGQLTNTTGGQIKAGALSLASQGVLNAGLIGAVSGLLSLRDTQDLTNSGQLLANADSDVKVNGDLDNQGLIDTRDTLTLQAGKTLNNAGQLISSGVGAIQVGQSFTNQVKAQLSMQSLKLSAASLTNDGTIQTLSGPLQLTSTQGLTNQGNVSANGDATLTLAGNLQNSGTLQSTQALTVANAHQGAIGTLSNTAKGQIKAAQLNMNVASLSNAGLLGGTRALQLHDQQDLTNTGQLLSTGSATLQVGGNVTNQGAISARNALQLSGSNGAASGALTNQNSASMTGGSVSVKAASVTNAGQLGSATGNTTVSSAATLTNSGQLLSQQDLTLALPKGLTNTGTLAAQGTLTVHGLTAKQVGGALSNGAKASIKAGQMDVDVSGLSNAGVMGATQGTFTLNVQGDIGNSGQLAGNADVTLALGGTLTNQGLVTGLGQLSLGGLGGGAGEGMGGAGGVINLKGASLKASALSLASRTLSNAGLIGASQGTLALTLDKDVTNTGTLASNGDLTVTSDHQLTNTGTLVSAKTLTVRNATSNGKGQLINASGGTLRAGGLNITDEAFSNHGAIQVGSLGGQWAEQGDWVNDGQITASGALVIGADGQIANQGSGAVQSASVLQLKGASGTNAGAVSNTVNGLLSGASGVAIAAASLTNAGQLGSASGSVATALTGNLTNTGLLYGGTNLALRLDGDAVNNQGDMLAQQSLTLRGLSGANAASLVNENSGMMEAVSGDVGIASTTLSNSLGSTVKVTTTKTTRHYKTSPKNVNLGRNFGYIWGTRTSSLTVVTTTEHASNIGNISHILAGGNIVLSGRNIMNQLGEISANKNITIHANNLNNEAHTLTQTKTTTGSDYITWEVKHENRMHDRDHTYHKTVWRTPQTKKTALTPVYGSISAGQTLTVNVTGTFNNVGTRQGAAAQSLSADAQKVAKKASVQTVAAGVSQSHSLSATHPTVTTSGAVHVVASSADKQDTQALQAVRSTSVAATSKATVRAKAQLAATSTAGALTTSAVASKALSSSGASTLKQAALTRASQGSIALTHRSLHLAHVDASQGAVDALASQHVTLHKAVHDGGATTGAQPQLTSAAVGALTVKATHGVATTLPAQAVPATHSPSVSLQSAAVHVDPLKASTVQVAHQAHTTSVSLQHMEGTSAHALSASINAGTLKSASPVKAVQVKSAQVNVQRLSAAAVTVPSSTSEAAPSTAVSRASAQPLKLVPTTHPAASTSTPARSAMTLAQSINAHAPEKTIIANVSALEGHKALFVTKQQAKTPYLIETRSKFIKLSQYVGSDYYLKQIGRDKPSTNQRKLGDSYVENRLIENQIFELTGKHYLGHQTNASDEIKALYNNAVDERQSLDLKDGVALSADEITHLKKNIVWLVKENVNGQSVLVPHLYLASVNPPTSGAQVSGQHVAITANQVNNSGAITAGVDLTVQGLSGVNNQQGLLSSGGDLTVKTNGTLNNDSGSIKGKDITLVASNLTNDTLTTRVKTASGYTDTLQSKSSITALNNLSITTTGNLSSVGSQISAGDNVSLDVGGDITLGSTALKHYSAVYFHHGHNIQSSLTHVQSSLTAGGALSVQSGHNLTLTGAHLKSGQSTSLLAKNNLTIQAAVDQHHSDYFKKKHHGGMFHHSKTVSRVSSSTTAHNTTIQSGGNLTLQAGNSATLAGITGLSKKNLTLVANNDIQLASLQDHHTLHVKRSRSGTFSTSKKTEDDSSTTTHASSLSAGDGLSIKTKAGSLTLTAVHLKSGGKTTLSTPVGILALNANTDEDYQQKSKHSNSTVWQGMANKGHMVTTVKGVTMTAGGSITLNAGRGVVVQYKKTGSLDSSLNELAKTPGMRWINTLRNNPKYAKKVDWQGRVEQSKHWSQKSSGLSGVGAAVIQLAGSAIGLPPQASKAAVSLINNHGNIKHTVKDLSQGLSLKGIASSAVTQALSAFVSDYFDVPNSPEALSQSAGETLSQRVSAELQQAAESHLIKAASSTAANVVIGGKSLKATASHALRNAAISTVTGVAAHELSQYALAHHQAIKAGDSQLKKLGTELEQSAEQNLVHAVVATGVNATVGGKSLKSAATQALRQSVLTTAGQVLSEQIGDYALTHHIKEGDIRKVLAHAVASCAVAAAGSKSCVASAIGAGVSELTAKTVGENKSLADQHTKANVQALISGVADVLVQGRKAQVNDAAGAAKTVYQYNYLKHKDLVKAIEARKAYLQCAMGRVHCSPKKYQTLSNTVNAYLKKSRKNSQRLQAICQADSDSAACQKGIQDLNGFAADMKHYDALPQKTLMMKLAGSPRSYNTYQALGFDDLALQKAFKTGQAEGHSPKQIVDNYQHRLAVHNRRVKNGFLAALTTIDGAGAVIKLFDVGEAVDSAVTEGAGVNEAKTEDVKVDRNTESNPKAGKGERSGGKIDITVGDSSIVKGLTQELSQDGLGVGVKGEGKRKYLDAIQDADGSHTVWKEDNKGEITNYQSFELNTNPNNPNKWVKGNRTDITGKSEFNKKTKEWVKTPHTHDKSALGGIRPAKSNEIPKQ